MNLSSFEQRVETTGSTFGVAISTLRPVVVQLLEAIRTSGFFRTYSDHSIRHCVEMFKILEWLIPDEVKTALTDAECALLVLAIYFHDLGMLATQQEFDSRDTDQAFRSFQDRYVQTFSHSGTLESDQPTLDHFIFEEYIRHTHAQRIRNWITGKETGTPQAKELLSLLHTTSEPFKDYLALICESHHLDNLYDHERYPLDLKFSNSLSDTANIQFLAVALRLADILHMSRDRTPPLEFSLISPKNPVSAREWAKQLQVTGVGLSATDPTAILVHALCKDPRQYFYLKDFIRVCDSELNKCRSWLEANPYPISSRYHLTARIVSDAAVHASGFIAERFELQLDHRRIIDLLMGHSLYGDQKVAIRELMQNSIDAIRVRRLEEPGLKAVLHLHLYPDRRELTITDNGIGMDLEIIRRHFLRIGDSYYRSQAFHRRCPSYNAISQFGIGFLSAFMIADRVTITTWSSASTASPLFLELEDIYDLFTARELTSSAPEAQTVHGRGTSITLRLRSGIAIDNLADEVRRWLVFLEFPIQVRVGNDPPVEVHGILGTTPGEIAHDILDREGEDFENYVPIILERDGVQFVILWPGGYLGTVPVLEPAGRYILPLFTRVKKWSDLDWFQKHQGKEHSPIRKVANAGVYLADDVPGLKFSESLRVHYVVDCRGQTRFTPLVSRAGIAVDAASITIVDHLVSALSDFISSNVQALLENGVSKYFCSYYASAILALLFDRSRLKTEDERIISVIFATAYAAKIPFVLIKEGQELNLKSFSAQSGRPIVLGRNVYDGLLRSVAQGIVDFPVPREVLDSLPDNFILSMGAEGVLRPLIAFAKYRPTEVLYVEKSRGVFVRFEEGAIPASFGSYPLLDFPHELRDICGIRLPLVSCVNGRNALVNGMRAMVDSITEKNPGVVRSDVEERCFGLVFDRDSRGQKMLLADRSELKIHLARRLEQLEVHPDTIEVSDDFLSLFEHAQVIADELWTFR